MDRRKWGEKAMVWLMQEEKEDKRILHEKNGKERQLSELPDICVDDLCEETRTVY